MPRTFYQILGCFPTATDQEIKRAYRRLSKRYHPDLNPHDPNATAKFIELQHAYELLTDPIRRAAYDASLNQPHTNFYTTNQHQQATSSYPYQQPVASKRRQRTFMNYRFFPGIGVAIMIALLRMLPGNQPTFDIQPTRVYYSTPPANQTPQTSLGQNNNGKLFAPPPPQALQQIHAGQPVWLSGKLEHRLFDNPSVANEKESAYLLNLVAPVLFHDSMTLKGPLMSNSIALIVDDSNVNKLQPWIGRTITLRASLELATTLHQHASVIGTNIILQR